MPDPEAGTVSAEQAMALLLMTKPKELKHLETEGYIRQAMPGRYWLRELVQGFAKYAAESKALTDTATLSACFGMTAVYVRRLASSGVFKQLGKNTFNWVEACGGYIKFLRDEDRRSTKSAAESRMRDAKARDIEVRTMQRLSRLVPLEVYEEMIDSLAGMVRSEFAGLAAACTRDLSQRRIIEREVNARLRRIAEHAMAQAIRLETMGGVDAAIGADRAGSMGGGKSNLSRNGGSAGAA